MAVSQSVHACTAFRRSHLSKIGKRVGGVQLCFRPGHIQYHHKTSSKPHWLEIRVHKKHCESSDHFGFSLERYSFELWYTAYSKQIIVY